MSRSRDIVPSLLSFLRPHRTLAVLLLILGFLASLSEGIGISLFIPFFQSLDSQYVDAGPVSWLGSRFSNLFEGVAENRRIQAIAAAIFGAVLLKSLLSYVTAYLFTSLSSRAGHELRTRVFEEVLTADFRVLQKVGRGRMLNVLSNESWRTADAITTLVQSGITLGTLLIYVVLLLLISWKLTIVVAALLVLIGIVLRLLTHRVGALGEDMTRANADVARSMVESVDGIEVIRGHAREEHERSRFARLSTRLAWVTKRTGMLSGAVYPVYEILAAAILIGVLLTSAGTTTGLASLLVFVFVLYRLAPVFKRLEHERVELLASVGSVNETFSIIGRSNSNGLRSGSIEFESFREQVLLNHVSYSYGPDSQLALDDLCANIPASGLTAIVGPSGSGKSTLLKLLLRFFDPTRGNVLVDGSPLHTLDIDSWRRHIAVVPQEAFLFSATVRDNIAYGRLQAGAEDIIAAAKSAGAHDFVMGLADGYETKLGEDGVELSGGERQRICLARAIIRDPELLILDEATNAMDSISENLIHTALNQIKENCAVVAIAHRLATVEIADQILVLDNGRLVEQGDLQQLISQGGLFARLYELQRFEHKRQSKSEFL